MAPRSTQFSLPIQIVSPGDLARVSRELQDQADYLAQAAIRRPGTSSKLQLPHSSPLLNQLAAVNDLNFLQAEDCQMALGLLEKLSQTAPIVHLSFAANPSSQFVSEILSWFRKNIHAYLLMRVGLEPSIAAGCILRTTNKQFDFSLRQNFTNKRELLTKLIDKQAVTQ